MLSARRQSSAAQLPISVKRMHWTSAKMPNDRTLPAEAAVALRPVRETEPQPTSAC